jgi:hypothetical protein
MDQRQQAIFPIAHHLIAELLNGRLKLSRLAENERLRSSAAVGSSAPSRTADGIEWDFGRKRGLKI